VGSLTRPKKLCDMYYKHTTEIEFEEKIDTHIVNRSIRHILKGFHTDNIETFDNVVRFRNSSFSGKCRSNIAYMTIVSKGTFNVINNNNKTKIKYETYSSFWGYILIFILICIAGLKDIDILIMGGLILSFALLMTYLTISKGGVGLLNRVKERIEKENINK
jgi:hypothetical protein